MRIIADPIQLGRQIKALREGLREQALKGQRDQDRVTGRVGLVCFPDFMTALGGELYQDINPEMLLGAMVELVGKEIAAVVETLFEEDGCADAVATFLVQARDVALAEITASQKQRAEEAQHQSGRMNGHVVN